MHKPIPICPLGEPDYLQALVVIEVTGIQDFRRGNEYA
jgi:hypothetical protein